MSATPIHHQSYQQHFLDKNCLISVSYTHLDVYKRQVLHSKDIRVPVYFDTILINNFDSDLSHIEKVRDSVRSDRTN